MQRVYIRSIIFNILFFLWSAACVLLLLPTLLFPRSFYLWVVHFWTEGVYWLERIILNLKYEIRGKEHFPENECVIIASKHQSTYETLKLHRIFGDPAIVLKKELLSIPVWGQYLKKSDVIAIDRKNPDSAVESLKQGAKRMMQQHRPIIIFPQGTRVKPTETPKDKRYRIGAVRMQEATKLPIIPLALNTGMFWPKHGFLKSSGTVIFEFLPPVKPQKDQQKTLAKLEKVIEEKSNALMQEALENQKKRKPLLTASIFFIMCAAIFMGLWFAQKQTINHFVAKGFENQNIAIVADNTTAIKGFPLRQNTEVKNIHISWQGGNALIPLVKSRTTPYILPYVKSNIFIPQLAVNADILKQKTIFLENITAQITPTLNGANLKESSITWRGQTYRLNGSTAFENNFWNTKGTLSFDRKEILLQTLQDYGLINKNIKPFIASAIETFHTNTAYTVPFAVKNNIVSIAGFSIASLNQKPKPAETLGYRRRQKPKLP